MTLSEKVWDRHVVRRVEGEPDLLYVDLHLVHEVTSPQAFDSLRMHGRTVRRPDLTVSTIDHNNPTTGPDGPPPDADLGTPDGGARPELPGVRDPALRHGRPEPGHRPRRRPRAGPDAAGDDRSCAATRTRRRTARSVPSRSASAPARSSTCWRPRPCRRRNPGPSPSPSRATCPRASPRRTSCCRSSPASGPTGGLGSIIEYRGSAIRGLSMEGRMTVCNMSIEAGARAGHGRPRRHDVLVSGGSTVRADGQAVGAGARRLARAAHRRRSDLRQGGADRRVRAAPLGLLGHEPRPDHDDRRGRTRPRLVHRPGAARVGEARAPVHGTPGRHPDP